MLPDRGIEQAIHYRKTEPDHFDSLTAGLGNTFVVWGAGHIAVGDWLRVTSDLETGKSFRRFTAAGPFIKFYDVPERQRHMATFRIEAVVKTHRSLGGSSYIPQHDAAVVVEISAPF